MTESYTSAAGTAAAAASTGVGWSTIISMAITLITAFFTGGGTVTDDQAAALNAISPGLGSAFSAAVSATNGGAQSYLEWRAQSDLWGVIGGSGGIIPTVWGFLRDNPLLAVIGGYFLIRLISGNSLLPKFGKKNTGISDFDYDYAEV